MYIFVDNECLPSLIEGRIALGFQDWEVLKFSSKWRIIKMTGVMWKLIILKIDDADVMEQCRSPKII